MQSESESEVAQSCPTLCDPMDDSLPGSTVHGIFQARILEWAAISFSRGSSQPRDQTHPGLLHCRQTLYHLSHQGNRPSNEYSGMISFKIALLDLLAVQETLKSLLQQRSSKASILRHSAFFQLSHPYMTTGKTIALPRQTFVGKVMSLLLNMLSRLVITFLPRSKRLLISCCM